MKLSSLCRDKNENVRYQQKVSGNYYQYFSYSQIIAIILLLYEIIAIILLLYEIIAIILLLYEIIAMCLVQY